MLTNRAVAIAADVEGLVISLRELALTAEWKGQTEDAIALNTACKVLTIQSQIVMRVSEFLDGFPKA